MEENLALVKELMAGNTSIEEFTNSEKARAAGLFCKDGVLFLQFGFCPFPMLAEVDKLGSAAWRQCTTGYSKVPFRNAFACDVDVELLQSVKMGDPVCLMKITLHNPIWQSYFIFMNGINFSDYVHFKKLTLSRSGYRSSGADNKRSAKETGGQKNGYPFQD